MKLLIDSVSKDLQPYIKAFRQQLGAENVVTYDENVPAFEIATAVVWNHRPDLFKKYSNMPHIASLGAGVDHILRDPLIPPRAVITRVISDGLTIPMSNFCIGAVMYFHRKFDQYLKDKSEKQWNQEYNPERNLSVGIMGMGVLGSDLAVKLSYLGFDVAGFSQSRKNLPGIKSFISSELDVFLAQTNLLICMLPATAATKGMLNQGLFEKMPKSSFLINVGRGHHQVDEDIHHALDSGQLAGAFLDVFPVEPLPKNSPLWDHPNVFITPHVAVVTKLEAAVPQIVENHRKIINGETLMNQVNREKGY